MTAGRLLPTLAEEEALWASGRRLVAGVDEVGRGPMAGPVLAAAVVIDPDRVPCWVSEVRDSKVVQAAERERLAEVIRAEALAFGIGAASVAEIDGWGITYANRVAMCRALSALGRQPSFVLIDGPSTLRMPLPQRAIVDGDALCVSISAASIVAKVARDDLMRRMDEVYPDYGFASHKGYTTREHLERLARHGPCVLHRRAWQPVRLALEGRLRPDEVESEEVDAEA